MTLYVAKNTGFGIWKHHSIFINQLCDFGKITALASPSVKCGNSQLPCRVIRRIRWESLRNPLSTVLEVSRWSVAVTLTLDFEEGEVQNDSARAAASDFRHGLWGLGDRKCQVPEEIAEVSL